MSNSKLPGPFTAADSATVAVVAAVLLGLATDDDKHKDDDTVEHANRMSFTTLTLHFPLKLRKH